MSEHIATFGDRLKEALQARNMKQSELCLLTGIPKSAMSQYISGAFLPKQKRLWIIAHALNVNEAWLMGYDEIDMERKHSAEMGSGYNRHLNHQALQAADGDDPILPYPKMVFIQTLSNFLIYSHLSAASFAAKIDHPVEEVEAWFTTDADGALDNIEDIAKGFNVSPNDIINAPIYYSDIQNGGTSKRIHELLDQAEITSNVNFALTYERLSKKGKQRIMEIIKIVENDYEE